MTRTDHSTVFPKSHGKGGPIIYCANVIVDLTFGHANEDLAAKSYTYDSAPPQASEVSEVSVWSGIPV